MANGTYIIITDLLLLRQDPKQAFGLGQMHSMQNTRRTDAETAWKRHGNDVETDEADATGALDTANATDTRDATDAAMQGSPSS